MMSYLRLLPVAAVLLLVTVSGCGSARMIQSSPDGGVVAIPNNSNAWPYQYRDHAEKLDGDEVRPATAMTSRAVRKK